jgi:ABC-type microcin C transport system permease subunit YejE
VALPLLVISVVLGVVVGGLLGMVGGAVLAWRKHDTKLKSVIGEL